MFNVFWTFWIGLGGLGVWAPLWTRWMAFGGGLDVCACMDWWASTSFGPMLNGLQGFWG